ncbi:MAG: EI24 domain-containing protein [Bdellovibrionota bacterium]
MKAKEILAKPLSPFFSFWFGLTLPLRSLGVILNSPRLMVWSLFPITLTLALYYYLIRHIQTAAEAGITAYFNSLGWNPQGWGTLGLVILTKVLILVLGAFTFSAAAGILSSPFNDFLAEAAEPLATPPLPAVKAGTFSIRLRLIGIDILKTLFATALTWASILVSWIPILNLMALMMTFLLVCFQFISYPQTRRGEGIGPGVQFLFRHLFSCLGFGAAFTFLFAIPIVSSFAIPLAVVSGTLLYARAKPAY